MMNDSVLLSVVVVIGRDRDRAGEMLTALAEQTAADKLEAIIVDTAPAYAPVIIAEAKLCTVLVGLEQDRAWGQAMYAGFKSASAPVIAFLEDHCIPARNWAEMIIAAHDEPWAAVGYAFRNGSPDTYLFRSIFIAEYGFWADPAGNSTVTYLPGNNISYKRAALLQLGNEIEHWFSGDDETLAALRKRGLEVTVEPAALVAHQATALGDTLRGHFSLARLSASSTYGKDQRPLLTRLAVALVSPFLFPPVRLFRLLWCLRQRPGLKWRFFAGLPVIYLIYQWAAVGISMGCLFGEGVSRKDFEWSQLNSPRVRAEFLK